MKGLLPIVLLAVSNAFMTVAWYGHLKYKDVALWVAILGSWLIALPEYCFQVPANRWGHPPNGPYSAAELLTIAEALRLATFCVFSVVYLQEPVKWNYLVGFCIVLAGAVVIFRKW
ncbi:MAG: DMT family protein [Planctomycetales bacterium]|nr:DMT family protein [Planctomycetales bacterium]